MLAIKNLVARVSGLVYEKTQRGPAGLELTLKAISHLQGGGALDFGGSEYRPADCHPLSVEKGPEDKYGWWHLSRGLYRMDFNEALDLADGESAMLTPHPRLLEAGANHNSLIFGPGEPLFVVLQVFEGGLSLKENCRTSRLNLL